MQIKDNCTNNNQTFALGEAECKMYSGSCSSPATTCHSMQGIHNFAVVRKPCSNGKGVTVLTVKLYSINKCYDDVKGLLANHQLV